MWPEGSNSRCLVVAEVGQAHDGSLGLAHAFLDAVADAGADAVKFQTHIAEAESTRREPWRVRFSPQDESRYDYWQRTGFTEEQWCGLRGHADERGLLFLSSPFSNEAVDLLARVGVAAWKIASGEVGNLPLLDRVSSFGKTVILSSGMSTLDEIDAAVDRVREHGAPVAVLQCTSIYPCPPEKVGLNMIDVFRRRYGCRVGLSDHSGTIYTGMAASAVGIDLLEVHVTLSRQMFGPDVPASVTTAELRQLVDGIRFVERLNGNPVDKDALAAETAPLRAIFTKSVVAKVDLEAGTLLRDEHLALRKPGTGISASRFDALLGKRLRTRVAAGAMLLESDLE